MIRSAIVLDSKCEEIVNNNNKKSRVIGGVVPFLDGLVWRPRLASPSPAPCEAQVNSLSVVKIGRAW